jgi:virulence-associated protein VapD
MHTVPVLWPSRLTPASEVEAVKDLYANLMGVHYNVEAWAAALKLYQFTEAQPSGVPREDVRRWRFLAANECVMQLHHFKERIQKIKGFKIRGCPSLSDVIDHVKLRQVSRALDESFPHIDRLRDAVAHTASIDTNPKKHAPDGLFALVGFREKHRFSSPYEGSIYFLDLNAESMRKIEETEALFLSAFVAAAAKLEFEGHLE